MKRMHRIPKIEKTMLEMYDHVFVGLAATAAGAVNALAGRGSLTTFPTLFIFFSPATSVGPPLL
jgi:uncharacterized membrane protein YfcA